ncbi:MAG: hypothetical protein E6J34_15920 [Chloroflexi bacterium]|nr:MAG: hypothetical protein E6J34_15920 [Chloroflexota bacterium]
MTPPLPYPIHPIADVAIRISQGEDPWHALGNFLHDWWCYAVDYRHDLIARPPAIGSTSEGRRWAAFCAATVEELCARTSFPRPAWINQQDFFLAQPWFYDPQPSQRNWLLSTTPEPFKRRNIFVGGSVLDNKYELEQLFSSKPRWTLWSDQELQELLGSTSDKSITP